MPNSRPIEALLLQLSPNDTAGTRWLVEKESHYAGFRGEQRPPWHGRAVMYNASTLEDLYDTQRLQEPQLLWPSRKRPEEREVRY